MDFDPRVTSDGWQCNFHFGYGQDIIDEDVQNEKSCMQVLRLLIVTADAEILDLEDELAILQCQLKWAESNCLIDPYELFCAVFKRKIHSLTSSIETMSNKNGLSEEQINATSQLQRPTERIRDVIYALIRPKFSEFDEEVSGYETSEKCVITSKEVKIKAEKVDYDLYNSLARMLNHVKDDLNLKAFENHSAIFSGRKKSSLSSILKPERQKVRQKLLSKFCDVDMIIKSEPEIVQDLVYAYPFQARSQQQERRKVARMITSSRGKEISTGTTQLTKKTTDFEVIYDLKNVRTELCKDPECLFYLKQRELREILRQNKIKGLHHLKKDRLIEELTKRLCPLTEITLTGKID